MTFGGYEIMESPNLTSPTEGNLAHKKKQKKGARFIHLYILCRMAMESGCLDRLASLLKVGSTTSTTG